MDAETAAVITTNVYAGMFNLALLFVLKITCFIIGFLIVKIGAELLREGVKGEFKFGGSASGNDVNLTSASPGLLFLLLGVVLIGYAMWVDKTISIDNTTKSEIVNNNSEGEYPIPKIEELNSEKKK